MSARLTDLPVMHALEAFIGASLLIVLVLLLRRPVARHFGAGLAYALWLLPLVRLVMPPLPGGVSIFAWLKSPQMPADVSAPAAIAAEAPGHIAAIAGDPWMAAPATLIPAQAAPETGAGLLAVLGLTGLAVWLAGAIWMACRSMLAHARFMTVIAREGTPVTGRLADLAADVSKMTGLKRPPRVVTSLIASGPFVTGLLRPTVVLPAWFAEDYTESEARAALAHELMHVKRGDLWALQAAELALAAMWLNPLAYFARRAFRTDQEAACDADVLARGHLSPHAYGAVLVKAVRLQTPAGLSLVATGLPLTHALKERLKLMSHPTPDRHRRRAGTAVAALLGAGALAVTASIATAGESHEIKDLELRNGSAWLDGQKIEDRQIVLLSDPVGGLVPTPPLPPGYNEMSMELAADIAELTGPELLGPIIAATQNEVFREIGNVARELAEAHSEAGILRANASRDAATEARLRELDAQTRALEAQIRAIAGNVNVQVNADTEARIRLIEHRIENRAAGIEATVERHYGPDHRARISDRTQQIAGLVSECRDTTLTSGDAKVLTRTDAEGKTLKIACFAGGEGTLSSGAARDFIASAPGLSEEERAQFRKAGSGNQTSYVYRSSSRASDARPEPVPAPPEAPEPPRLPERR